MTSAPLLFLLDTNTCVSIMNARPARVRGRMKTATDMGHALGISSITLHELQFGVHNSARPDENSERLSTFVAGLDVFAFGNAAAEQAAIHRAVLKRSGQPIGPYDLLIAGHALALNAVLVTNNTGEFGRVEGLNVEDWTA